MITEFFKPVLSQGKWFFFQVVDIYINFNYLSVQNDNPILFHIGAAT